MKKRKKQHSIDLKIKAVELSNHRGELKSVAEELHTIVTLRHED